MNRRKIAKEFAKEIVKKFKKEIISIHLYGSVAEGTDNKESDIDVFILTRENKIGKERLYNIVVEFLLKYSELVSIALYTPKNLTSFARSVLEEGVILYGRKPRALKEGA